MESQSAFFPAQDIDGRIPLSNQRIEPKRKAEYIANDAADCHSV
jgi:hypothetical protein